MPRFLAAEFICSAVPSRATAMAILMAMCLYTHLAYCNDGYQMIQAVQTGDSEKVQALIQHDPDVVFQRLYGSPLHWAALCGFPNVVEVLLGHNSFVNETDDRGWTPLHYAANHSDQEVICRSSSAISHERVVRLLLAKNAFVDYPDPWGKTPLHLASEKGLKDVMKLLLASGANPNLEDGEGCTPLHYAVTREHLDVIGLLLAKHVDVNAGKGARCGTPLKYAAASGYIAGAELLLANGAEVNAVNAEGDRPLCDAASNGHTQMVLLLLANKADVNGPCGPRQTPLYKAKLHRYDDTAQLLRLHGGTSDFVRPPVKRNP